MNRRSGWTALALLAVLGAGCTSTPPEPAGPTGGPAPTTVEPAPSPVATVLPTAEVAGAFRPTVRWPAVPGAVEYRIAVAQTGGNSWAWSGADTQVVLGGGAQDRDGLGFRLTGEATLFVAAVDAAGTVLEVARYTIPTPPA